MKYNNLKKILKNYGDETVRIIKDDIRYKKLIRTGKLLGSISYKIVNKSGGIGIEFFMIDYGKFVDEGTIYIKAQNFFKENINKQYKKWEVQIKDAVALDFKSDIEKTFLK